jgi:hypothetical protein
VETSARSLLGPGVSAELVGGIDFGEGGLSASGAGAGAFPFFFFDGGGGECFFLLGAGAGGRAFLGGAAAGTFKFRKEHLNAFQFCIWRAYVNACCNEPINVIKMNLISRNRLLNLIIVYYTQLQTCNNNTSIQF